MGPAQKGQVLEGLMAVPTPQEQVLFLQNIQRLLSDGRMVASYKFALLRALSDLAVRRGDDSGAPLRLSTREIAEVFIELYWRQVKPFCRAGEAEGLELSQNTGRRAGILRLVEDAHGRAEGSLVDLRADGKEWESLKAEVAEVVAVMPLWKLQRVGPETVDFLYPNAGKGREIALRGPAVYCLRKFYGITRLLVEGAWADFVRKLNLGALGQTVELRDFLFGAERSSLSELPPILEEVQKGACFYCAEAMGTDRAVDHFIPWAKYPVDLGHNFVLAHARCNAAKTDYLACEKHLERWGRRNADHGGWLGTEFSGSGIQHDLEASRSIARWAYEQTKLADGLVWDHGKTLVPLGEAWFGVFRYVRPAGA